MRSGHPDGKDHFMEIGQTAQPQMSPDGQWWWDGQQWNAAPVAPAPLPYYPPPAPRADGLAIASLVLSILWVLGLGSIAAVVMGHVSRSKASRDGRPPSGLALGGLILGYLGVAFTVFMLAAISVPVFHTQRAKAQLAVLKADLRSAGLEEEVYNVDNNTYTDLETLRSQGLKIKDGVSITVVSSSADGICLAGSYAGQNYYYDSANGGLTPTPC